MGSVQSSDTSAGEPHTDRQVVKILKYLRLS